MIINTNISALNNYRQMGINNNAGSKAMEKLSSGLRINRAGDDAAGLAISEKMRAQVRGLDQASRNSQDGISMIQTAEGALQETHNILQRMRELATQASNDTNVAVDRNEIQKEMNQLTSEINRIGNTTEFNTQSLLKGKDAKVTETAAVQTTIKAGEAGVAAGAISALSTEKNSVKAVNSTVVLQGNTAAATGEISNFSVDKPSVKGQEATVSLKNGLKFTGVTAGSGTNLNDKTIEIKTVAGTNNGFIKDGSGNYTITIGEDNPITNQGELYNAVKAAMEAGSITDLELSVPVATDAAVDLSEIADKQTLKGGTDQAIGEYQFEITKAFKEAGDTITIAGKTYTAVTSGADATKGEFDIDTNTDGTINPTEQAASLLAALTSSYGGFTNNASAGGVIKLTETTTASGNDLTAPTVAGAGSDNKLNVTNTGGQNLKNITIKTTDALESGAVAATGESAAVNFVQATAGGKGTALNGVSISFGTLTTHATDENITATWDAKNRTVNVAGILETTTPGNNQAKIEAAIKSALEGAGFDSTTATIGLSTGGTGAYDTTTLNGKTLTFGSGTNSVAGKTDISAADSLVVDQNDGNLTIYLADTTASKNAAAKIEDAVKALGKVSTSSGEIDFSKYTFKGEGDWDTKTVGENFVKSSGTLVGGTEEVKGTYNFDLDKAFAAGDKLEVAGQVFTAVESGADLSKGEFNVSSGDIQAQASSLRDALSLNDSIKAEYNITGSGSEIKLTEKVGDGKDLKNDQLDVRAAGTQGEYAVKVDELLGNGATFVLDGEEITVSDKNSHVGYENGTAIKATGDLASQTKAIADAINANENLNKKYTASVGEDGGLALKQTEDFAKDKAPEVSTKNSPLGNFTASFQIGANSGQSMTIEIGDMRANALGVSGDGSTGEIAAKNGKVASFVETANVTDGTNNKNTEFALDISTHEKASAAISVINDAIESISAQRSNLGAFQNRLEHTISNLGNASENLTAAESRVRDVDMAKEVMEMTRANILGQASQAMLAQANQKPQSVLQLLG